MPEKDYITKQREYLVSLFRRNPDKCFTNEDVVLAAESEGSAIGQTTVYRNLEKLVSEGVLIKHTVGHGNKAFFKLLGCTHSNDHHHLFCTECGSVEHLECADLSEVFAHIKADHHFVCDPRRTVFYGKCAKCSAD